MRARWIWSLFFLAAVALGHGSTEDQPPPEEPPPPPPAPPKLPPNPREIRPPAPPPPERGPHSGGDHGHQPPDDNGKGPAPAPPSTPDSPNGPTTPRPQVRPAMLSGKRSSSGRDWHVWWEFNREYLLGLRGLLRRKVTITGRTDVRLDALAKKRAVVLGVLRDRARKDEERLVRAAALIALGRMGTEQDAYLMMDVLKNGREPREVQEAAAVGLGVLPPFRSAVIRRDVSKFLQYALYYKRVLPERARGMLMCAAGLRARSDPLLKMQLLERATGTSVADGQEAAHLAYALGLLGDPIVVPELLDAARKGSMGGKRLTDIERAHAVTALGLIGDAAAANMLVKVLHSRRSRLNTKRSAALALGRILRERQLDEPFTQRAARALRQSFEKENDTLLRGYCAVALGGARKPEAVNLLMTAIDHGGNMDVKPFCALALGLAARTLGVESSARIRTFLGEELSKTNYPELGSSLSIALGLARADEARDALVERLQRKRLPDAARGAAAEGLGLMETPAPEVRAALLGVVRTEVKGRMLGDAVLALALMGQRAIAPELVKALEKSTTAQVQGRLMLALNYLNHEGSVEPLLKVLENRRNRSLIREFAAVALGLMGDRRDEDVLFSGDAYFNLHATTRATYEWVRLY